MATLGNPKNTIAVLQKYQFNFQKKFGQNFLIDTGILEEIIEAAQITKDDFVLEIGPGIGTMTQYLCETARAVVAVEIDTNLIPILKDTLAVYNNVDVLNEDILKVINELRAAGAEAISLNDQRLISTSEIRCAGPTISVNNTRVAAPFVIKAIGNAKSMEDAIKMRGGVAETLSVWGIQVDIKKDNNIVIPAYKGATEFKYVTAISQ